VRSSGSKRVIAGWASHATPTAEQTAFGIGQGLISFQSIDGLIECIVSSLTGLLEPNVCFR
jgi:hypothetical protein